jgi:RNA polymerase sigma-70 factor (family 1)
MPATKSHVLTEKEFEKIYDSNWSRLFNLAYYYFKDRATAQEVVQEVFIKLWLKREELGHIQNMEAYLHTSIRNKVYDQFDKIYHQEKLLRNSTEHFKEESQCTEEQLEYEETLSLINREIDKLPNTTKTIFRLSRFDRYSNDEIAVRLQLSSKAVEYHITQALKKLRPRVGHWIVLLTLLGSN